MENSQAGLCCSAQSCFGCGCACFRFHGFAACAVLCPGVLCSTLKSAPLVGHADQKHRLFRVLQNIDNPVGLIFEVNVLAVGDQMDVAVFRHRITQPLAHFLLQEPQHAADFLQRESLTPQFGDHRNFNHFLRKVNAPVAFLARRNDVTLIPPLQLAKADAGDARYIAAGVALLLGRPATAGSFFVLNISRCLRAAPGAL